MRKIIFLSLAVACLASCDKESYRHSIAQVYPTPGTYGSLFADQLKDSIAFTTFDSYQITTNDSWVTIDPDLAYMKIENSYWYEWYMSVPVTFEANATGETRDCMISVYNYGPDDWSATMTISFLQFGWHNISRPTPAYEYGSNTYPVRATFSLTDSATQVVDTLAFTAYNDWTLACDDSTFVHLQSTSGSAGSNHAPITLSPNEESADRSAVISLTSSGVTTEITLTQTANN
ncbi:MAG: hypothetical protein LUC44_03675 [Prevotellaceae bacterium]|nr:hypothetical protein [Prevotellaceae bacterium]